MLCRCGIADWRALRKALGLTQMELADLLGVNLSTIWRAERSPHRCPSPLLVRTLRSTVLHRAKLRDALRAAAISYPWPNDLLARRTR